jgi:type I restriction enzyme S subunit
VNELPSGWAETTLGELAAPEPFAITDGPFGSSLKTEHYVASGARVIRLTNIGKGSFLDDDAAYISEAYFAHLLKHQALPGDLVTAALGDPLGRTCIVPEDMGLAIVKADCFRFRCHPVINKDYLHNWLNSPQVRQNFVERSHGIGRLRINLKDYRVTPVLLPPDAEQRRIVAKLDTLSARSKRARAELDRAFELVQRLKSTILTRAFCGDLTSEWRASRSLQVGEKQSLQALLLDDAERGEWACSELPEGWGWMDFDAVVEDVTDSRRKLPSKHYHGTGAFPIIDQGEKAVAGYTDDERFVQLAEPPLIVFGDHTRCVKLVTQRFVQGADGIKVLKPRSCVNAEYLYWALSTVRLPDKGYSRHMKFLRRTPLPICSLEEQAQIVGQINTAFRGAGRIATEAGSAAALLNRLDQAILAKAFSGELVPRDPNDEPASALLARIRAGRAAEGKPANHRRHLPRMPR